jgi:hypothetical protein
VNENLNQAIDTLMQRFEEVNQFFIDKVADQILTIGQLNPTSINRITIMTEMGANINEISQRLALATSMSLRDLFKIYQVALDDTYTDPRFEKALQNQPLSTEAKTRITQYTQAVSVQTAQTIKNLSNTTAISQPYSAAIDKAVLAVSSGLTDYQSATREAVREIGYNGMPVTYQSGYRRRLDTAIRQNVIDGANQIAQNCSIMMGEDLGYDAFEISAHARSAPDHEPIQGRVFLKADFDNIQNGRPFRDIDGTMYRAIRRPIGEWNCMHIAMSFSTKYSTRRYTDNQLRQWAADNKQGCTIEGKHYSIYEAGQLMREIETEIRRQKDVAVAAQRVNDDTLRQQCQKKINALSRKYNEVAKASNITPRRDRMTVQGFKPIKVNNS